MRRLATAILVGGAATCALGVATKYASTTTLSRTGQLSCASAFFLCGVVLALTRGGKRTILACVLLAVVVLGVLMALSDPIGMGPLFYLWPVVYVAYFYPPRVLAAVVATMALSLGTGLASNAHEHLLADTFFGVCTSVGVMGAVVAWMTRQQTNLRRELARAAQTDPLTGLLNRRAFDAAFGEMIGSAQAAPSALAVVLFDIDFFKRYNDSNGHLAGDAALRALAAVLGSQSRSQDAVCRFGGEEFLVALTGTGSDDARTYVQRVAEELSVRHPPTVAPFTISAGIGVLPDDGCSYESLVKSADQALYHAKELGRDMVAWRGRSGELVAACLSTGTKLGSRTTHIHVATTA